MTPQEIEEKYLSGEMMLKSEYNAMSTDRSAALDRARLYSRWTIPALIPEVDTTDATELQQEGHSVGARAVNNLANKIMMALFQPTRPFFRAELTEEQRADLGESGLQGAEVDEVLAAVERESMKKLHKAALRSNLVTLIKHLITAGNVLLVDPTEKALVLSMADYVVQRGLDGVWKKIIIEERKRVSGLPDTLAELAKALGRDENAEVSLFTAVMRIEEGKILVWQEMEDIAYAQRRVGIYTEDTVPYIPLTWELARGRDWGTGLVEENAGDFSLLSTFASAIKDYATVATDIKILVNPEAQTDPSTYTESDSGAYVYGKEGDLFVHSASVAVAADFLENQFQKIERRIGATFLMNSAVTRDAERVTAEEIRQQAQELESSLGGVYSRLSVELQLPLAKRLMREVDGDLKDIEPTIITGLEALSRTSELDRVRYFLQDLAAIADIPDEAKEWIQMPKIIKVLGVGHGVDYKKFLRSKEEVQADRERRLQEEIQVRQAGQQGQPDQHRGGRPA